MSPQRNHNQSPQNRNHESVVNVSEQLREKDAAAPLVDSLRDIYTYSDPLQRETLFDKFDGSRELYNLIGVARSGVDLDEGEKLFVWYMGNQASNVKYGGHVNMEALEEAEGIDNPNDAVASNVTGVIKTIKAKINDAEKANDTKEAARLKRQIYHLEEYQRFHSAGGSEGARDITEPGSVNGDNGYLAEEFMKAWKKMRYYDKHVVASDDEKKQVRDEYDAVARELKTRGHIFRTQAEAMDAITEHAGEQYGVEPNVDAVEMDTRFEYKDTTSQVRKMKRRMARAAAKAKSSTQTEQKSKPAVPVTVVSSQTKTADTNSTQQAEPVPSQTPVEQAKKPSEQKTENNSAQSQPQPQPTLESRVKDLEKQIEKKHKKVIERLDGNGQDIKGVRNELAEAKAKIFRNTKIGRKVMGLLGVDVAQEMKVLEKKYVKLTERKFGLENYFSLRGISHEEKTETLVESVEAEQNKLRQKTSEHMRNTLVGRFCKAIGTYEWRSWKSKHYWIAGIGLMASPFTGGLSGAAAAALLTAAKIDKSVRGMPEATKRMSSAELEKRIGQRALEIHKKLAKSKKKYEQEVQKAKAAGDAIPPRPPELNGDFYRYRFAMREALRRFDGDINWELGKRGLALGIGATAAAGYHLGSAAAGFGFDRTGDAFGVGNTWNELFGPAEMHMSEWQHSGLPKNMPSEIVDAFGNRIIVKP